MADKNITAQVIFGLLLILLLVCIYLNYYPISFCNCKTVEKYSDATKIEDSQFADFNPNLGTCNNYQRVDLNAPLDPETGSAKSLLFGKINRIVNNNSVNLDVEANLYVLGGDTYDSGVIPIIGLNSEDGDYKKFYSTTETQKYKLYISDNSSETLVGSLLKDGDGIYKLQVELPLSAVSKKIVNIYYENDSDKVLVLTGEFQ